MVADGIHGVTANPTIFASAIGGSADYDEQLASLVAAGCTVEDAYWELVVTDITDAVVLAPGVRRQRRRRWFRVGRGRPRLAHDAPATIAAARRLHAPIDAPNLLVKIPATAEGVPAIEEMIAEGRNINVTLIFSLTRYSEVIEAYLSGLETFIAAGGDPSTVHSVASFFVSRVDSEVDPRLEALAESTRPDSAAAPASPRPNSPTACSGTGSLAPRWDHLSASGAHHQRPLWALTSTKTLAHPDTVYVDSLIGPDTVTTLPEDTIDHYEDHGTLSNGRCRRGRSDETMRRLDALGIDMEAVA